MISFQIVQRPDAALFKVLKQHMRDNTLRKFSGISLIVSALPVTLGKLPVS